MKHKRIVAYLIDTILIILLLVGIRVLFQNQNMQTLRLELNELNQSFLSKQVGFSTYINHYSSIMYDMDKQNCLITLIGMILMILYFVILPYKWNGQTIGKKMMHIKIIKNESITIKDLFIRSLFINGLGYGILTFILLWIFPSFSYFLTASFIGILQIILVIVSLFMILYNKNGKDLEDIITQSEVIHVEEVKK